MPTHKLDLGALSLTQLSELTGSNLRTVAKRLREAGVETSRTDGRTLYFDPRVALPVVLGSGEGLNPAAQKARLDSARADSEELKLRVRRGELIEAAAVFHGWAAMALAWKNRIRAVPAAATIRVSGFSKAQARQFRALLDETLTELADGKATPRPKRPPRGRTA